MSHSERASIESLLAHRGWVSELALKIARDENAAEDLAQDVWMAALRNPPQSDERRGSLRAWLATVLRNRARERHRGAERREAREARVARVDVTPATAEIVSRADAHRHVVTSVLTLDEPYRTTVLFLYFEGLSAKRVAERLDIPVDTVRTRARRALQILRARLDRDHGGERRAWVVPLLGLDIWKQLGSPTGTGTGVGVGNSTGLGMLGMGAVMATGTKVGFGIAGIVVGVLLTVAFLAGNSEPDGPAPETATADTSSPSRNGAADGSSSSAARGPKPLQSPPQSGTIPLAPPPAVRLPSAVEETIRGRVLDTEGRPVVGATVRGHARRRVPRPDGTTGPPPFQTEAELVAQAKQTAVWDAAMIREAVTDAEGRFTLDGLRQATYEMRAWADGCQVRPAPVAKGTVRVSNARPGETFDFQATRQYAVSVSVLDPDGKAPADATVLCVPTGQRGGGWNKNWTPEKPTLQVHGGKIDLTAKVVDGEDEWRSDPVTVNLGDGSDVGTVELRLKGVPRIRGNVVVAGSQRWERLRVFALEGLREGPLRQEDLRKAVQRETHAPEHAFTFDDLTPGTYTVALSHDGRSAVARVTLTVGSSTSLCTLEMPELGNKDAVSVRVLDPNGEPVTDATFNVEVRQGTGLSLGGPGQVKPQDDGTYLVPLAKPDERNFGGPEAAWTLLVNHDKHGRQRVPFVRGRDGQLEVQFAPPTWADVTLLGYDPAATAHDVVVVLTPTGSDSPSLASALYSSTGKMERTTVDAEGRRTFKGLSPGRYDLQVWWRYGEMTHLSMRFLSQTFEVRAGANELDVRMPQFADVAIRVPGLGEGGGVELHRGRSPGNYYFSLSAKTDADGTATWKGLPPGRYVAAVTLAGERKEMPIEVQSSNTFTFEPQVLNGLRIRAVDAGGQLATAGFRPGDIVQQIGGREFDSRWNLQAVLSGAKNKRTTEYVVLRDGGELTLTGPGTLLSGFFEVGGHWDIVAR